MLPKTSGFSFSSKKRDKFYASGRCPLSCLHQSKLHQIMIIFFGTHSFSPCAACAEVGTQDKDSGCTEQQVLCADLEISSGEFLPPEFSSPYVTCPLHREKQKIQTKK